LFALVSIYNLEDVVCLCSPLIFYFQPSGFAFLEFHGERLLSGLEMILRR
jgi:hypothetical protein